MACKVFKFNGRSYATCETGDFTLASEEDWVYLLKSFGVSAPPTAEGNKTTAFLQKEDYDKLVVFLKESEAVVINGSFGVEYVFTYAGKHCVVRPFVNGGKYYLYLVPKMGSLVGFVGKIPVTVLYSDGEEDPEAECKQWKERAIKAETEVKQLGDFFNNFLKGKI